MLDESYFVALLERERMDDYVLHHGEVVQEDSCSASPVSLQQLQKLRNEICKLDELIPNSACID